MENKISVKQNIIFNSVPDQQLTYANQLSVHSWNNIINTLSTQANSNAIYLKTLHTWLIGTKGTDISLPSEKSFVTYVIDSIASINATQDIIKRQLASTSATANKALSDVNLLTAEVASLKQNMPDEAKYTNDNPTTATVGGIEKGSTFSEKTISEMFDMLLYPYQPFSLSTSLTPALSSSTIREHGNTITINSVYINITQGTSPITNIVIKDSTQTILKSIVGEDLQSMLIPLLKSIVSDETLYITVKDAKGTTRTATYTFKFISPYYYGATDSDAVNADVVSQLTKKISTKTSMSLSYNLNKQRAIFAYPASYGSLRTIKDANGFDVTDTFYQRQLTINDVVYTVYFNAKVTANMVYTFTY